MKFIVHTDGGARGNPGPAAIGVVVEKIVDGRSSIVDEFGKTIGEATNNVAEYTAVAEALKAIKQKVVGSPEIHFYLDSTLVVNQLNGLFKIKDPTLRSLVTEIRILEQEVGGVVHYTAVPRQQNWRADFLVNQALGARLAGGRV
jgi:ribonuclease HI